MQTITVIFTRRTWNPISLAIRWAMPRSQFAFALSSHAIVVDGDTCYEATMLHGVRKSPRAVALAGQVIVKETRFFVPDRAAGVAWGDAQLCTYDPVLPKWLPGWLRVPMGAVLKVRYNNYDFVGAFGLALAPGRDWAKEDCWFCYEFVAAWLRASGRPVFANLSHIGETALMALNPSIQQQHPLLTRKNKRPRRHQTAGTLPFKGGCSETIHCSYDMPGVGRFRANGTAGQVCPAHVWPAVGRPVPWAAWRVRKHERPNLRVSPAGKGLPGRH